MIETEKSIEDVRRFWDRRPCNIRHSIQPIGTLRYFDEVEQRKYFVEPHIPSFADFPRWHEKRVLEIGCGIGTDTINFARHGAHVTTVELSAHSLDVARQRARVYGLEDRIRFVNANAEALDQALPVEPFDLIYSFGVIHHTPHPDQVLAQLQSYCHDDTVFKLMVYHRYAWKVFWLLLTEGNGRFWETAGIVARHSEAQTGCPVTYTYNRASARQWLETHGYRIEEMHVDHIFPYRIKDYIAHRYRREWYFQILPQRVFRWLEHRFGWHLCITARSARSSLSLSCRSVSA